MLIARPGGGRAYARPGERLIGTRTSAPFSLSSTLSANTYTITAVATDGQGASTTSASRTIVVSDTNLPPTVSITAPSGGANYPTAPAGFTLSATANAGEVNGWVTKVEFYVNGSLVNTDTSAPWSYNVSGLANGSYTLTAKAFDQLDATTTSAPITITVGPQPKLHFVHVDHLNTPRAVYDDQQRLEWKWDQQEPFGDSVPDKNPAGVGPFEFALRFPGQYFDKETNLAYNNFRDYNPSIGRYVESDPAGLVGGLNTFVYGNLNPLRYTDPDGLFVPAAAAAVEAIITIAGGLILNEARKNAESLVVPGTAPTNARERGRGKWKVLVRCEVRRINDCCDWPKDKPWVYGFGRASDYWDAEHEASDAANDALSGHQNCFKGHCHPIRCWYNDKPTRCLRWN